MDEKSLELLEFPLVREQLASYTAFPLSRELALKILPLNDYEQISLLLVQSAEARRLLAVERGFAIVDIYDIREAVRLAAIGKILEPPNLLEIRDTIGALCYLRNRLSERAAEFPALFNIAEDIVELRDVEKDIDRCFDTEGEIKDNASPKLEQTRQQLKSERSRLLVQLQDIISSQRWQNVLQEAIITERGGRYVIPVKVELRREVRGIIHDVSNTGATAFVEPYETIDAGNNLRQLEAEEKYEIERILRDLSSRIGAYHQEIIHSLRLTAEIDLALAKARYARSLNAVEPVVVPFNGSDDSDRTDTSDRSDQSGNIISHPVLKLINARHPLLPMDAVPLSLEIGNDFSVLVITGPNTGGKTVALKTIGLLSLMAQAGLPVPAAAESTIPLFDSIFADIGDEQSIAQTLSTFSWHVTNLVRIVNNLTYRSLVLLDELGTSTDPAEGSALARSLLLYLLKHGVIAIATTHFSELKAFAHTTPGLQNASLDFDPTTLAPTYHLTIGIPGGSNALATAARFGLTADIVEGARRMLSPASQELETLLADIVTERQNVSDTRILLEREKEKLVKRNLDLENELQKIRTEEKRIITETRDNVVRETSELFREIRQASAELRKEKSKEKIEQARKAIAAAQEKLKSDTFAPAVTEPTGETRINVGDMVWLKEANLTATVLSLDETEHQVELRVGQAKLRVGLDAIEKTITPPLPSAATITVSRPADKPRAALELDLRGKRAEEVKELVDSYLNNAAMANLPWVRIIHGYGTGVVRQIVRETLARHILVKSYRPGEKGEGGDGVTVANLK